MSEAPPLTIAYVVKGFWEAVARSDVDVTDWMPEMDLMNRLIHAAEIIESRWPHHCDDWPGVWEYDVSEPIGAWIAEEYQAGRIHNDQAIADMVDQLVNEERKAHAS